MALPGGLAHAQDSYPSKPVRVIVNFPPGAGTDIATRLVTAKLSETLGQQFLVDNRAGAAGNIGVELAARAAPDGYTLLTATAAAAISQTLFTKISFDLTRDFTPIAMIASAPFILAVHPSVSAKSLQELIVLAKAKPGQLSYATPGTGSSPHLAGELLKMQAGIDLLHVPYKGMVPAITDVIGGNVSIIFGNTLVVLPNMRNGRVRGIAITSAKRSSMAPELPTIAESGFPGFESGTWYGMMAPARTPREVITKLSDAATRIVQLPDVREKLIAQGAEPLTGTPARMGDFVRSEIAKWGKVAKAAGLRAQ
ncbi:MAG TPA: tripartite tricarboxylate transporter substrate binding protein [Burkholderiales bacterium]|nr:tripartite tricarboxylate transporter substrate binding protein [Burkholderiales bacterium]